MLEAAEALSEAAKTDGYKAAVRDPSLVPSTWQKKADASVAVDAVSLKMIRKSLGSSSRKS